VSEEARNYARKVLRCHNYECRQVKVIEETLRHPWQESDENIGGSHVSSFSSPQEKEFDRVWTNDEFVTTVKHIEIVQSFIRKQPDYSLELLKARYLNDDGFKQRTPKELPSWVKVANEVHLTEDTCKKQDVILCSTLARMLSLK